MRKIINLIIILATITIYCASCARGITTYEAAHGKNKCGRYIR